MPSDALFMAFLMPDRLHSDFVFYDLVSDILSNGNSSRMYNELVRRQGVFSELNAYITGDRDQGLFVIDGRLHPGFSLERAEEAVWQQLDEIKSTPISDYELAKVVN